MSFNPDHSSELYADEICVEINNGVSILGDDVCCFQQCREASLNSLTPRAKPWVIQSFLTFDSMYTTLRCAHLLESF